MNTFFETILKIVKFIGYSWLILFGSVIGLIVLSNVLLFMKS